MYILKLIKCSHLLIFVLSCSSFSDTIPADFLIEVMENNNFTEQLLSAVSFTRILCWIKKKKKKIHHTIASVRHKSELNNDNNNNDNNNNNNGCHLYSANFSVKKTQCAMHAMHIPWPTAVE